jgi:hypothetical protein
MLHVFVLCYAGNIMKFFSWSTCILIFCLVPFCVKRFADCPAVPQHCNTTKKWMYQFLNSRLVYFNERVTIRYVTGCSIQLQTIRSLFFFSPWPFFSPVSLGTSHYRGFTITLRHTTLSRITLEE